MSVIKIFLTECETLYFCFSWLKYFSPGREQRKDKAHCNHEENCTNVKWITVLMCNTGSQRGTNLGKRNTAQHCSFFFGVLQAHGSHLVIYSPRNWRYFFIAKAAFINVYHYLKIQNSVHIAFFKNTDCIGLKFHRFHKQLSKTWKYYHVQNTPEVKGTPSCWFWFSIICLSLLDLLCGSIQKDCNWCF